MSKARDTIIKSPIEIMQEFEAKQFQAADMREMLHGMDQRRFENYLIEIDNQVTLLGRNMSKLTQENTYEYQRIIKEENDFRTSLPSVPNICETISAELNKKYLGKWDKVNSAKEGTKEYAVKQLHELITKYKEIPANDEDKVKERLTELYTKCEAVKTAADKVHNKGKNKLAHTLLVGKDDSAVSVAMHKAMNSIRLGQERVKEKGQQRIERIEEEKSQTRRHRK
jgi:hypothetical protein